MDPNPKSFPILSHVLARLPSIGPTFAPATPTAEFDIEQPPSSVSSSSPQTTIIDRMPNLSRPKLLASMTNAVSDVAQTRSALQTLGPRPDHESVDVARSRLAEIEANLSNQLEEIVLSPRSTDTDSMQWRSHLSEEEQCRHETEKEKATYRAVLQLDELHEAYEKMLKEAEERLVRIYENAETGAEDEDKNVAASEEENPEVARILQEAFGGGLDRVDLSGRRLKILPEAFGRIQVLVVLNLSSNQLEVSFILIIWGLCAIA